MVSYTPKVQQKSDIVKPMRPNLNFIRIIALF